MVGIIENNDHSAINGLRDRMESVMNCLRKKREIEAADPATPEGKKELEELEIILQGRYVAEDYLS
jgi:hypothetical protein